MQKTEFVENNSKRNNSNFKFLELTYFVNFQNLDFFIKKFNNKPKVSKKYPKYVGHFPGHYLQII